MKKVLFILAVAFAGFAASCNNASEADANKDSVVVTQESTTVVDSTVTDSVSAQ